MRMISTQVDCFQTSYKNMHAAANSKERAKGSPIWMYFMLARPTSSTAACNICNCNVPRGGDKTKNYNTTNLIKHLQRIHSKEHAEFIELRKQSRDGTKQLTLSEIKERSEKFPPNNVKAAKITEKILHYIVLDGQPLSVVGDKGFRLLMNHLEPRYDMVTRKYLSETALPELYSKVCKHVSEEIKDVKSMSFTTDIWSSDVSPVSLLSLTVHWLDVNYVPHSAMLSATNFRGSHISDAIAAAIKGNLDKWQIPLSKVHVILRDDASNMRKAMDNMGVRSLDCVAHTMQLVINEGLVSQRSVSDAVASGRHTVAHFKHSPLAYSRLQDIQLEMNMAQKRLKQDIKTRWNSTYFMIESLLEKEASPVCLCC